jgi:hypothetical protein
VGSNGQTYTSPNLDTNWTPIPNPGTLGFILQLKDGTFACLGGIGGGAGIFVRPSLTSGGWAAVKSSAGGITQLIQLQDGTFAAVVGSNGQTYTSPNLDTNWTPIPNPGTLGFIIEYNLNGIK